MLILGRQIAPKDLEHHIFILLALALYRERQIL